MFLTKSVRFLFIEEILWPILLGGGFTPNYCFVVVYSYLLTNILHGCTISCTCGVIPISPLQRTVIPILHTCSFPQVSLLLGGQVRFISKPIPESNIYQFSPHALRTPPSSCNVLYVKCLVDTDPYLTCDGGYYRCDGAANYGDLGDKTCSAIHNSQGRSRQELQRCVQDS